MTGTKLQPLFSNESSESSNLESILPAYIDFSKNYFEQVIDDNDDNNDDYDNDWSAIIEKAINITKKTKKYHILMLLSTCQFRSIEKKEKTKQSLIKASHYPLSIIVIGIGDGPWDEIQSLDDHLSGRWFDNLQFVPFLDVLLKHSKFPDVGFALNCLMEIPDQYEAIKRLKLL